MKAAQIQQYGDVEEIAITNDADKPKPQPKQILVAVKAASLNRIDSAIRNGYMQKMLPLSFPATVGGDFAGVVSEVGEEVTAFKVGDEVYGNAGAFKGGSGSLAEFVAANAEQSAIKPKTVDFTQTAALPLVGASALQGIEEEIIIQKGQKILIQGGAGGIGSLAVQIAKMHGAYVAATAATDDMAFVKNLGADEVIDYKTQDASQMLKDYDAVFDTAGGEGVNKLFAVLKKGGKLVSMAGQPDQEIAKEHDVEAIMQMTKVTMEQLQKLAELIDSGKVKVHVEKTFSFDSVKEAFTYFETQHPKGKVVVTVSE